MKNPEESAGLECLWSGHSDHGLVIRRILYQSSLTLNSSVGLSSWPGRSPGACPGDRTRPSVYIGTVVLLRLMAGSGAGHDG